MLPSNWTTHQETESDEDTGAKITKWYAIEPSFATSPVTTRGARS